MLICDNSALAQSHPIAHLWQVLYRCAKVWYGPAEERKGGAGGGT